MTNREMNAIKNPAAHKEGLKNLVLQCLRVKDFAPMTIDELKARHEMLTALPTETVTEYAHELATEGEAWEGQDENGTTYYALFPVIM